MNFVLAILLIGIHCSAALAQEKSARQLYRLADDALPVKGHLLGPETGGTPAENFETCAHERLQVSADQLIALDGDCGDQSYPGTFAVEVGKLRSLPIYTLDQVNVGTVRDVTLDPQGTLKNVVVDWGDASSISRVIPGSKFDVQRLVSGDYQVILKATRDAVTSGDLGAF